MRPGERSFNAEYGEENGSPSPVNKLRDTRIQDSNSECKQRKISKQFTDPHLPMFKVKTHGLKD